MRLLDIFDIKVLIEKIGLSSFYLQLIDYLRDDFAHWSQFQKMPRTASYVPNGVIELMPVCGEKFHSFKYVNGHPHNSHRQKMCVVAFGALSDVETGYPLMLSEMTILTAIRTAATSALASSYLAKKNSKALAIIGCGAQSEFQVLAHDALFNLKEIRYFDVDEKAMQRFSGHLSKQNFSLISAKNAKECIDGADIIITATAAPGKNKVIEYDWLLPGQHISGIGGDSVGKTELDPKILAYAKIVVEFFEQTIHEGEIQNLGEHAKEKIYAELWELATGKKPGRTNDHEITLFDDVGFALEDYSILRLVDELANKYDLGREITLIPEKISDVKDLFGLLL